MTADQWDVIVAGGGPGGLSAALMLGRARRRVLVIDAGSPRNRFATHMHGVLGQEGVPPVQLLRQGREEAARYGVEFADATVQRVERITGGLRVTTDDATVSMTRSLIVATGLSDHLPPIPGLAERWGVTVLHCPYCHGWEVRDRRLGVLVTSPWGLHQAELVRQWSGQVTVFTAGLGSLEPDVERRLQARGVRCEPVAVREILGNGTAMTAVLLADGREVAIDAIFTAGTPRPHDGFLAPLALARTETPFGAFIAVDAAGKTSDDRIWAVGNVVNPAANVPMAVGAGSFTGGAVNAALVGEDFDIAVKDPQAWPELAPADFWEERYAGSDRVWSGAVNAALASVAGALPPGRALDLGCGEGGDAIWLAEHGWTVTGVDISPTAISRASSAAVQAGLAADRVRFIAADLATVPAGTFDLVSASFLHSPVDLPRVDILKQAALRVAPDGHLLITSHADFPPWAQAGHRHEHRFLSPAEEVAQLELDPASWEVVMAQTRPRQAIAPDGASATIDDVIVLARRR